MGADGNAFGPGNVIVRIGDRRCYIIDGNVDLSRG